MDCVEFWIHTINVWKKGPITFLKISSICKCLPCFIYQKRESNFPKMWLSTLWEMWYSLCSHTKDHQWSWSHNDKIQHWKVFHVHFGLEESKISSQLMHGISIQLIDKDMGVPISEDSLIKAISPETSRYVNSYILITLYEIVCTVSSNQLSINLMVSCIYGFT